MPRLQAICPECGTATEINSTHSEEICSYCGKSFSTDKAIAAYLAKTANQESKNLAVQFAPTESEDAFLRGSSYLALGDNVSAAGCFLEAAKGSPAIARYWLYLLYAVTDRLENLYALANKSETRQAGKKRVICHNIYRNFLGTAGAEDFRFAERELGINLTPESVWAKILYDIAGDDDISFSAAAAAVSAEFAFAQLAALGFDITDTVRETLDIKLNPIKNGIAEINTLMFCPVPIDGLFRTDSSVRKLEFARDNMTGSERFTAFLLTPNIENIGTHFPFSVMTVASGVTNIPDGLIFRCEKLEKVIFTPEVKSIGKNAFSTCINLTKAEFCEGLTEIGERAFFDTALRCAILPESLRSVGDQAFGSSGRYNKDGTEEIDISKYLFVISPESIKSSPHWNIVGPHRCGYILRQKDSLLLVYPIKHTVTETGLKAVNLTERETLIFKALACSYADILPGGGEMRHSNAQKGSFGGMFSKLFGGNSNKK